MRKLTELMVAAQACTTKEEARALVHEEATDIMAGNTRLWLDEEARQIVLSNIGYATGWLERGEAARLLDLFGARHPYFGAIEDWPQTPEETLALGMKAGMRMKDRHEGRV